MSVSMEDYAVLKLCPGLKQWFHKVLPFPLVFLRVTQKGSTRVLCPQEMRLLDHAKLTNIIKSLNLVCEGNRLCQVLLDRCRNSNIMTITQSWTAAKREIQATLHCIHVDSAVMSSLATCVPDMHWTIN